MGLERKVTVMFDEWRMMVHFGVVGEKGGVEFVLAVSIKDPLPEYSDRLTGWGLEIHSRTPFDCSDNDAPDHADCRFIDGPCWHDGTSLWASEYWLPGFQEGGTDWLWPRLEREYAERFEKEPV